MSTREKKTHIINFQLKKAIEFIVQKLDSKELKDKLEARQLRQLEVDLVTLREDLFDAYMKLLKDK